MKKNALLLASLILILCMPVTKAAEEVPEPNKAQNGEAMLVALEINIPDYADMEQYVTRKQFLSLLTDMLGGHGAVASQTPFTDIVDDETLAAVNFGLQMGLISPGLYFRPDEGVTYSEAYKMCIVVLGREHEARAAGDYPSGYQIMATRCSLTKGLKNSAEDTMNVYDMYILMFNLLHAPMRKIAGINGTEIIYGEYTTVLEEFFNLTEVTGVVTANGITTLYDPAFKADKGCVEIGGQSYKYEGEAVLGQRVKAYADIDNKNIRYMYPAGNREVIIRSEELERIAKNRVYTVDENGRQASFAVSGSAALIYNGKADSMLAPEDLQMNAGFLRLIDNNNDGSYDVVCVMEPSIILAESILQQELIIAGANGEESLVLSGEDVSYSIYSNNKELEFEDLEENMLLECYVSRDKKAAQIEVSTQKVNGTVTEIDSQENIVIDGVTYKFGSYFKDNYLTALRPGMSATFLISTSGLIEAMVQKQVSDIQYGYFLAIQKGKGLDETVTVKLMGQDGQMHFHNIAKKVKVNGAQSGKPLDVYALLTDASGPVKQLLRYKVDSEGNISVVDTRDALGIMSGDEEPEDNLTLYEFPDSVYRTIHYVPENDMVHPYFRLTADTVIFIISGHESLPDERRYKVYSKSYFGKANTSILSANTQVYNVNVVGEAGAMVMLDETAASGYSASENAKGGVVVSVTQAIDLNGDNATKILIYSENNYRKYYITDDAVLTDIKAAYPGDNQPIKTGDYIRIDATSDGIVTAVEKDFDFASMQVTKAFGNHIDTVLYYYGEVYSKQGELINMIPENVPLITPGYDDPKSRYNIVSNGMITVFDTVTSSVHTVLTAELISYLQDPSMSDKILVRLEKGYVLDIVLYK